jgi:hypothetical protein
LEQLHPVDQTTSLGSRRGSNSLTVPTSPSGRFGRYVSQCRKMLDEIAGAWQQLLDRKCQHVGARAEADLVRSDRKRSRHLRQRGRDDCKRSSAALWLGLDDQSDCVCARGLSISPEYSGLLQGIEAPYRDITSVQRPATAYCAHFLHRNLDSFPMRGLHSAAIPLPLRVRERLRVCRMTRETAAHTPSVRSPVSPLKSCDPCAPRSTHFQAFSVRIESRGS